jgi:hypothetical protein
MENIRGVFFNEESTSQRAAAFALIDEAVSLIRTNNRYSGYHLSFTGHSLGAFLAELSVSYAVSVLGLENVNAVTFESPGSKESILAIMCRNSEDPSLPSPHRLDIISYVCYPNFINVTNEHVGTVYTINVDLGPFGSWPGVHIFRCHSVDGIVEWFRQAIVEKNQACKRYCMSGWPVGFWESRVYFKYAEFNKGQYTIKRPLRSHLSQLKEARDEGVAIIEKYMTIQKRKFELRFHGNFRIHDQLSNPNVLPLHHFGKDLQAFLHEFYTRIQSLLSSRSGNWAEVQRGVEKVLEEKWSEMGMPEEVRRSLLNLTIRPNDANLDLVTIELDGASVPLFRRQISSWLERKGVGVEDLLNITSLSTPGSHKPVSF